MNILIDIITYAAPVGFACYGGLLSEKVGIVQISLEGMTLIGALAAVIATSITGNPLIGVFAAMACAMLAAALHNLFTLVMRSDHVIVGTAVHYALDVHFDGFVAGFVFVRAQDLDPARQHQSIPKPHHLDPCAQ